MTPAADLVRGEAEMRLPFRPELATMGDIVHGGAISSDRHGRRREELAGDTIVDEDGRTVAKGLVTYRTFTDGG